MMTAVARPVESINIVYIVDFQLGGSAESIFELVEILTQEYGANCTVVFADEGPLKDRFESAGVRTVITRHGRFLINRPETCWKIIPKYLIALVNYLSSRSAAMRRAEAAIDFSKVDIIHSNLPRNDLGVMLAAKHDIPHVCHLREFTFSHFRCWSYRKDPVRYLDEGTSAFIAVSKACGEAWVHRGVSANKMHVIYNGIDVQSLADQCARNRDHIVSDCDKVKMLFLGGCAETKGIWDAVKAAAKLAKEFKNHIKLDVYGHDGSRSAHKMVRRFIAENELQDIIEMHGRSDDVATVLSGHDIGLVCSNCEAFGRIVVEFWAAGLAVVGADTGAIPELLENGKRGYLYHKSDGAEGLYTVLRQVVLHKERLKDLKEHGTEFAKDYGVEQTASSVWEVYNLLLHKK